MLLFRRPSVALLLLLLQLHHVFQGCSASCFLPSRAQPRRTAKATSPRSLIPSRRLIAGPSACPTLSGTPNTTFSTPIPDTGHASDNITCMAGSSDVQSAAATCQAESTCMAVLVDFEADTTCSLRRAEPVVSLGSNALGGRRACLYVRQSCPVLPAGSGFTPPKKDLASNLNDIKCFSDLDVSLGARLCQDDPLCVAFVLGYSLNYSCIKFRVDEPLVPYPPTTTGQPNVCFYEKLQVASPPPPVELPAPPPGLNTIALAAGLAAALVVLVLGACVLFCFRHNVSALLGIRESNRRAGGEGYQFPVQEISQATGNFNKENFLGHGGFGEVYYGKLRDDHPRYPGQQVAVKRQLKTKSKLADVDFFWEAQILSTVRHRNVVELLGFCEGRGERYLVYEFVERGSLYKILKQQEPALRGNVPRAGILKSEVPGEGTSTSCSNISVMTGATGGGSQHSKADESSRGKELVEPLRWDSRIRIAVGAARGLRYLHYELKQEILHLDIKSDNILVDAQFHAKVADFGLSKMREESSTDNVMADSRGSKPLPTTESQVTADSQATPQNPQRESTSATAGSSETVTGGEGYGVPEASTEAAAQITLATGRLHGTRGYMDPSFLNTSTLTRGSDVYSFGIVLLELATGWHPLGLELDNYPVSLPKLVLRLVNSEGFSAVCAPSIGEIWSEDLSPFAVELVGEDAGKPEVVEKEFAKGSARGESGVGPLVEACRPLSPSVFKRFVCLAMWCCVHERDLRPNMDQVFVILGEIEQGKWRCRRDLGEGVVLDAGGRLRMNLFIPGEEEEGFAQGDLAKKKVGQMLEVLQEIEEGRVGSEKNLEDGQD